MAATKIEWADRVWNPVTGCTKVSAGCKNCYAEVMARRTFGQLYGEGRTFTDVCCHPERLDQPMRWRKPSRVFVNSMSDLFHEAVPFEYIAAVFGVMQACPEQTFMVLTKRHERMWRWFEWVGTEMLAGKDAADAVPNPPFVVGRMAAATIAGHTGRVEGPAANDALLGEIFGLSGGSPPRWPLPNVWLGVSVEDQATANQRIPALCETPAALRFVSAEPLLEWVDLTSWLPAELQSLDRAVDGRRGACLDWVIVGGESGPKARPCSVRAIQSLVDQCARASVPVFVKQLGARPELTFSDPKRLPNLSWPPRDRKGADHSEWPESLRVQQFPEVVRSHLTSSARVRRGGELF